MTDPTTASPATPVSPTGTPWIPAAAQKYIILAIMLALAVLGVLMATYPAVHGFAVAFAIVSAVAGVLGIASPGIRTPTVGLLLCCALVFSACPNPTPPQRAAINCAEDGGAKVLADAPAIIAALSSANYGALLDRLVSDLGPTVLCEASVMLETLKGAGTPAPMLAETPYQQDTALKAARLGVWLTQHKADYK